MILEQKYEKKNIADYRKFMSDERWASLLSEAEKFRGKKIAHINATPKGGGVAEILKSLVPLQQSLGMDSRWYYLEPDEKLFGITKKIHNSLQGSEQKLTQEEKDYYLDFNKRLAGHLNNLDPDVLMVHDPQPLASIEWLKDMPVAIRIHIDSTHPNPDTRDFLKPFINKYKKIVFTLQDFVPEELKNDKLIISPPAIDPLSEKNMDLSKETCEKVMLTSQIDPSRPVITQVSRFDMWKDPLGIIDAYNIIKKEIPGTQLILSGIMEALDDPEALQVLEEVIKKVNDDPDVLLLSRVDQIGDFSMGIHVNALQRGSDVIFQKSLREGFGLTVTEAMWKEKPVIGGNVGGIRLQIKNGENGFLVDSPEEAAQISITLLKDKELAQKIGKAAKESVKDNFLITRLLEDEFKIMKGA
ncbi:MAG: glycosyltransferase [Candidatus Spechtbacterales bacterium]